MTNKEKNREQLEEIADRIGDLNLMAMFWTMFDDLSEKKQQSYIKWALNIEQDIRK